MNFHFFFNQKYELHHDKTTLILYFDYIGATPVCPEVEAFRTMTVMDIKPSSVQVYDYKDHSKFYSEKIIPKLILLLFDHQQTFVLLNITMRQVRRCARMCTFLSANNALKS